MFFGTFMSLLKARYHVLRRPVFHFWVCTEYLDLYPFCRFLVVQFNFEGNYDLLRFIKLLGDSGMWVTLRIGPYIEAEWNMGYMT